MPLFIRAEIVSSYPSMSSRPLRRADGRVEQLYTALLNLLLRLNIRASTTSGRVDADELAKRTREVLEQFERNDGEQVCNHRVATA